MEIISYLDFVLPLLFFLVALVYSSVGLGGGSSYTAIMIIAGMSTMAIPMISLTLNLVVSTLGSVNFIRNKHARLNIVAPFLVSAIPMSYIGGSLQVSKHVFLWVMLISLVGVAMRIYLWKDTGIKAILSNRKRIVFSVIIGSLLGILSGIVGIGGGIYLVPLIIVLGLGDHKQAAAAGAVFVWVVSVSALISRMQYNSIDLNNYLPLIISVFVGGFIGSYLGSTRFNAKQMEKFLGIIILIAILLIIKKLFY